MGWCAADRCRVALAVIVSSHGCTGERRRSRRTTICRLHPRCELDLPAFVARPARRIHRGPYERRAGTARSWEAVTACRAWVVRMRVDQVGERGSPGRSRRARHEPDERVRGANPSDPPARPRQGIRASRDPDCSYASSRREATRPRWPRIPDRRHRLGRDETCRSPRDSFRRSGCVETVAPSVPCPGLTWCGRCGNTVGSPKPPDFTVLHSGSRMPRCPSAGSTAATTCGRSRSMKSKVFENPLRLVRFPW